MSSEPHTTPGQSGQPSPKHRFNGDDGGAGAAGSRSRTDRPGDAAEQVATEPEGLKLLLEQLQELQEYGLYYAAAKTDSVKCAARNAIRRMVLAALGFVAVGGLIIIASWFVLGGVAQGLGTCFGDRSWIGAVITGVLSLVGVAVGVFWTVSIGKNASRKRTVLKYETRNARQRERFGRDVQD